MCRVRCPSDEPGPDVLVFAGIASLGSLGRLDFRGLSAVPPLFWAFHSLGKNLTDTVVTRHEHTLVAQGPVDNTLADAIDDQPQVKEGDVLELERVQCAWDGIRRGRRSAYPTPK
jgi:hypothetical protein